MTAIERLWARVNKKGPKQPHMRSRCWVITGYLTKEGYGRISVNGKQDYAHRVSFALAYRRTPKVVRHRCDHPPCVRPSHLRSGTQKENLQDAWKKGRMHRGERHGSAKLTDLQINVIRTGVKAGLYTQRACAEAFEVSQSTISLIVNGKRRKR